MQTMDRIILREPPFHRSRTFPVHCTQVLVWFYSDDTFVHEGFSLEYQITPDPVAIQSPCEYNRLITPGQGGYSRHGFIKADTDNGSDGNMDCSIYLNASSEYHITMRIQYIAINCSEGLFEIYGEYSATPYCGFYTPDYSIYSIRNWHRYRFVTTSVSYCQSGFSFYYTTFHTENIMKSNYCFYLLATLMSMIATVSSDVYGYYHFDISSPCENNRVIEAGQGEYSRYGFIKADSDNCIDSHLDCSIHLNASSGYHITMRIQYIKTDCDDGMFEIHGETGITPYCGFYTPSYSIYSSTNWLKYRFHTTDVTYCQSGFSFYYTTYHTDDAI